MASLATIKELHKKVGLMPANTTSDKILRWYNATTKYIIREEEKISCKNQTLPKEACGKE